MTQPKTHTKNECKLILAGGLALGASLGAMFTTIDFVNRQESRVTAARKEIYQERQDLSALDRALSLVGDHRSNNGSVEVLTRGNHVLISANGYTPDKSDQPRFYGITRNEAEAYLVRERNSLNIKESVLDSLQ